MDWIVEGYTHKWRGGRRVLIVVARGVGLRLYSYRVISIVFTYYLHQQIRQHFNLG